MSSEPDEPAPSSSQRAATWLLAALVAAGAAFLSELLPLPVSGAAHTLARAIGWAGVGIPVGAVAVWGAFMGLHAAGVRELAAVTDEPILPAPALPPCRSRRPVVVVRGVVPRSGASTLTFNLAVLVAAVGVVTADDGEERRARPVCLLRNGALTAALGLDQGPLDEHLERNPYKLMPRLTDLAVRHPAGCELLCLSEWASAPDRLHPVVDQLRRQYDVVLLDGPLSRGAVLDLTAELAELVLLTATPTDAATTAAAEWADSIWAMGLEHKAAIVVNHVGAGSEPPHELVAGYFHRAQLPDSPIVHEYDLRGLPWCLNVRVSAARQLATMARQMFPSMIREDIPLGG